MHITPARLSQSGQEDREDWMRKGGEVDHSGSLAA